MHLHCEPHLKTYFSSWLSFCSCFLTTLCHTWSGQHMRVYLRLLDVVGDESVMILALLYFRFYLFASIQLQYQKQIYFWLIKKNCQYCLLPEAFLKFQYCLLPEVSWNTFFLSSVRSCSSKIWGSYKIPHIPKINKHAPIFICLGFNLKSLTDSQSEAAFAAGCWWI